MDRILLLLERQEDRCLLGELLAQHYEVTWAESPQALHKPFDLGILDDKTLAQLRADVEARKAAEEPIFLPLLLLVPRQQAGAVAHYLGHAVDELLLTPMENAELQARAAMLLRVRKLSRERTQFAQRLAAADGEMETFARSISHDLRAPLRAMQGFAEALLEDYAERLDPTGQDYARRIVAAAEHLNALIEDLLAWGRLSRAEMALQPVALIDVVEEAQRFLAADIQERQAQITVTTPLPRVQGHRATLVQVVMNLLANAIKFVTPDMQPQVRIWAEAQQGQVRLWVTDNGIGIAPEHQEHIFGVFRRLHSVGTYPGTGIGLAIVRKSMERLGGRAGVESAVGQGSRFWIELPQAETL